MNIKKFLILLLVLALSIVSLILSFFATVRLISLPEKIQMKKYYNKMENYISASGTVTNIIYEENDDRMFIFFEEDITPASTFTGRKFVIKGNGLETVRKHGFDEKVKVGSYVEFTTVPRDFGYARPIVSLTVNGETLLEFEVGYQAHLDSL